MTEPNDTLEEPVGVADAAKFAKRVREWSARRSGQRRFEAAANGQELEVSVLDVIGYDWWTGEGVTSKWVKSQLDANPDATTIRVLIDSPGGSVFDGIAIHNLLKRDKRNVTVEVLGEASSAASVIAMAGNTILMHEGSSMMIHRPSCGVCGFAEDLRAAADALDSTMGGMLDVYTTRTGRARADVEAMVTKETWMTATVAVKEGFADEVIKANSKALAPAKAGGPRAARAQADYELRIDASALETSAEKLEAAVERAANIIGQASERPGQQTEQITSAKAPKEENIMSDPILTTVRALLNLGAGTPDSDVTAAVQRLRDLEREVVSATGAKSTEEALGGFRAMQAKALETDRLTAELSKVRSERDKQNFDALIMNGQSARKLTPALVTNVWQPEFDAAQATGNGEDVVNRLRGFLTHAPIVIGQAPKQPVVTPKDAPQSLALTWNGKTYDDLSYSARAKLKAEDPELFALMKQDFDARNAA